MNGDAVAVIMHLLWHWESNALLNSSRKVWKGQALWSRKRDRRFILLLISTVNYGEPLNSLETWFFFITHEKKKTTIFWWCLTVMAPISLTSCIPFNSCESCWLSCLVMRLANVSQAEFLGHCDFPFRMLCWDLHDMQNWPRKQAEDCYDSWSCRQAGLRVEDAAG